MDRPSNAFWPWPRAVEAGDTAEWKGRRAKCFSVTKDWARWQMACHACGSRFTFRTLRRPSWPSVRCSRCKARKAPLSPAALEVREQERLERQARANLTRRAKSFARLKAPARLPPMCKPRGGPDFAKHDGWWRHALPLVGEFTKWKGVKVQCLAKPAVSMQHHTQPYLWRVECKGCGTPFTFIEAPCAPAPRLSCDACDGRGVFE